MASSSPPKTVALTPQQQAVVDHDHGPALVFAVAGAGKTTAMVQRIARLVATGLFPPESILAASFARANVVDLRQALTAWPACRAVDVRTLHALGLDIIRKAQAQGYLPPTQRDDPDFDMAQLSYRILGLTLQAARQRGVPYQHELNGLDRQDFLDYVGACKNQLAFANLNQVRLPPAARRIVTQAQPPSEALHWYLPLYQLYEEVRRQKGWITFDDMLVTAWELLVQQPELLAAVQQAYRCVLVDEFQDINLVQSELLDLIARPHGNYMAIGDDDQTIYEWRGAEPRFILAFAKRYKAQVYVIDDNFRCPAAPLTLANQVIRHNQKRQPKRLNLTQGFHGETAVFFDQDAASMSRAIVGRIDALRAAGTPLNDVAVLVRLNAQTPHIEQELIARQIPYRVSKPFYERLEIKTLIDYCRLAWLEREMRRNGRGLANARVQETFSAAWRNVCNRPKRYLTNQLRDQIERTVTQRAQPLSAAVGVAAARADDWLSAILDDLSEDLAWLADSLDAPADAVLRELETRLGYKNFLRDASGFPQTGEGRAVGVDVFIAYAAGQGSLLAFMQHVRALAAQKVGQAATEDAVTLATIHQAKGLEWPVVFVPQCNAEIMPFKGEEAENLEEERRLFYVALTRSRAHLYLHSTADEEISPFLSEARWEYTLPLLAQARRALEKPPAQWQAADALALARAVRPLYLERYFTRWWGLRAPAEARAAAAERMAAFLTAVAHRGYLDRLELDQADVDFWRALAPQAAPSRDFPGLEAILPDKTPARAPASPPPRSPRAAPAAKALSLEARLNRIVAAGKEPAETAVATLVPALADPVSSVRWRARTTLVRMGGTAVLQALLAFLAATSNPEGRKAARQALAALADNPAEAAAVRTQARRALEDASKD